MAGLGVSELARAVRQVAGGVVWRWEPDDGMKGIGVNKEALAARLVSLSLEQNSTVAA